MTGTPRIVAAAVGLAAQGSDAVGELAAELAALAGRRTRSAARGADRVYRRAAGRGDQVLARLKTGAARKLDDARAEAARRLSATLDGVAGWAEESVVRRVAQDMTPYLIDTLVPQVIDGVMPRIRAVVVPVVIEDLTADSRVRAMVAQQSRGALTAAGDELRRVSADADDRVESAVRRALHRRNGQ
jgi:hypothetical protein